MTEWQQMETGTSSEAEREMAAPMALTQLLERLELSLPDGFEDTYYELCDESRYVVPDHIRAAEPANQSGMITTYELQRTQSIDTINVTLERIVRRDQFKRRTIALPEMLSRAVMRSADEDPDDQGLVDSVLQELEALVRLTVDVRSDLASGEADIKLLAAEIQILAGASQQLLGLIQQIEGQQKKKPQPDSVSLSLAAPVEPPYPSHPPRGGSDTAIESLSRSQMLEVAAEGMELAVWAGPSVSPRVGKLATRRLFQKGVSAI